MRIAFISTRGIPNDYGGFEQFAEYISVGLANRGHEVTVYSPHFHPYKENSYKGVRIKHIYSPETWMGSSVGSFFYDFASLRDALKRERFDIIYEAGYTSIVPAYIWFNVKNIPCLPRTWTDWNTSVRNSTDGCGSSSFGKNG